MIFRYTFAIDPLCFGCELWVSAVRLVFWQLTPLLKSLASVICVINPPYLRLENFKVRFLRERKFVWVLKRTIFGCLEELNNLNLGGDAYLAVFTLIGAHSVVRIYGNKLKNERKCTPRNENMTTNVRHTLKKWQKMDIMVGKGDSLLGVYRFITQITLYMYLDFVFASLLNLTSWTISFS